MHSLSIFKLNSELLSISQSNILTKCKSVQVFVLMSGMKVIYVNETYLMFMFNVYVQN
jgi:hypothetical protein